MGFVDGSCTALCGHSGPRRPVRTLDHTITVLEAG